MVPKINMSEQYQNELRKFSLKDKVETAPESDLNQIISQYNNRISSITTRTKWPRLFSLFMKTQRVNPGEVLLVSENGIPRLVMASPEVVRLRFQWFSNTRKMERTYKLDQPLIGMNNKLIINVPKNKYAKILEVTNLVC